MNILQNGDGWQWSPIGGSLTPDPCPAWVPTKGHWRFTRGPGETVVASLHCWPTGPDDVVAGIVVMTSQPSDPVYIKVGMDASGSEFDDIVGPLPVNTPFSFELPLHPSTHNVLSFCDENGNTIVLDSDIIIIPDTTADVVTAYTFMLRATAGDGASALTRQHIVVTRPETSPFLWAVLMSEYDSGGYG